MKIFVEKEDKKIAYIQRRDRTYIRQFYSNKAEYDQRDGNFIKIKNPAVVKALEDMDFILDYTELIKYTKSEITDIYNAIKSIYNDKHKHQIPGIIHLEDMDDLSELKQAAKSRNTYDMASDHLLYMLEQLREFYLIRQGKLKLDIPTVMFKDAFHMTFRFGHEIVGTLDPELLILKKENATKINPKAISKKEIKTAIWLNYAQYHSSGKIIDADYLNTEYQMNENQTALYIKTHERNKQEEINQQKMIQFFLHENVKK